MSFRTRKYDQRIKFILIEDVDDGYGGSISQESVKLETFAVIEQLATSRDIEQAQLSLPATFRVKVMYRKGFEPSVNMRVSWRGVQYNIISSPIINQVRMSQEWTFDITKLTTQI